MKLRHCSDPGLTMVTISGTWRANCSAVSAAHLSVSTLRRQSLSARQTARRENSRPQPSRIPAHPPRHPAPPEARHAPALIFHPPAITSVHTPQQGIPSRKAAWITGLLGYNTLGGLQNEGLCTCTDISPEWRTESDYGAVACWRSESRVCPCSCRIMHQSRALLRTCKRWRHNVTNVHAQ